MVTIAFVGSTLVTPAQAYTAQILIESLIVNYDYQHHSQTRIVSGGAEGIDTICRKAVEAVWIPESVEKFFTEFLPAEKNWERGYRPRNIQIAEACDILWCIRTQQSETFGSGWTAKYAQNLGKTVHWVMLPNV